MCPPRTEPGWSPGPPSERLREGGQGPSGGHCDSLRPLWAPHRCQPKPGERLNDPSQSSDKTCRVNVCPNWN